MPAAEDFNFFDQGSRALISEAARVLDSCHSAWTRVWLERFPLEQLSPSAQQALRRLLQLDSLEFLIEGNWPAFFENIEYHSRRLAKLRVPLETVARALNLHHRCAVSFIEGCFSGRTDEINAAFAAMHHAAFLVVGQCYDRVHSSDLRTLLAVLDAELASANLDELLEHLLRLAAEAFGAQWGGILLSGSAKPGAALREACLYGVPADAVLPDAPAGAFFREVLNSGSTAVLLDAANDPRISQPYFREFDIHTVWAVPLIVPSGKSSAEHSQPAGAEASHGTIAGVLHVDFDRHYEPLPQELELLAALGERSAMAIERAQLTATLRENEQRIGQLSRQLLQAQDEERRRISRDLHDETGQALMVTRLYLEMARRQMTSGLAELRIPKALEALDQALTVIDRSAEGLRRIMARLSPLLLEELGLEAALRQELRETERIHHLLSRFHFGTGLNALSTGLEILIYRLVQEGLNNIAKHAQAQHVELSLHRRGSGVQIDLRDDGRGFSPQLASQADARSTLRPRFGLSGMRERVRLVGGDVTIDSAPGSGTHVRIWLPLNATKEEAVEHRDTSARHHGIQKKAGAESV